MADSAVHGIGVSLGIIGAIWLAVRPPVLSDAGERLSVAIYAVGLIGMLTASAAYNMWPHTPAKKWLRRIDHCAIYIMIAATYTPFVAQIPGGWVSIVLFASIWTVAAGGLILTLTRPGRHERLSVILYLALGWSGLAAYDALSRALDTQTWWLLGIGGAIYSAGVGFHLWKALPFHNVVWHVFVLTAAIVHYFAVLRLA